MSASPADWNVPDAAEWQRACQEAAQHDLSIRIGFRRHPVVEQTLGGSPESVAVLWREAVGIRPELTQRYDDIARIDAIGDPRRYDIDRHCSTLRQRGHVPGAVYAGVDLLVVTQ